MEILEGKNSELEGQIHIGQTVNTLQEAKIDDQEQYSWWSCLVIRGLAEPGEEDESEKVTTTIEDETGIPRNTVIRNIDKTQQIGLANKSGKQRRIVKFTSDSSKEAVCKNHKEKQRKHVAYLKWKNQSVRVGYKFQQSLTVRRMKLFELANEKFEVDQNKFTYADMYGNMKVMLKSPVHRRYVLQIHTENDIVNILSRLYCEYGHFGEISSSDGN